MLHSVATYSLILMLLWGSSYSILDQVKYYRILDQVKDSIVITKVIIILLLYYYLGISNKNFKYWILIQNNQCYSICQSVVHAMQKKIMMNTPNTTTTTRSVFYYSVWDPTLKYQINSIEMVQHKAIRFICNLKGREIISAAANKLKINTLKERRKGNRHSLLQIRSKEDNNHQALANSYDKLINDRPDDIAITRVASRQHPATIIRQIIYISRKFSTKNNTRTEIQNITKYNTTTNHHTTNTIIIL